MAHEPQHERDVGRDSAEIDKAIMLSHVIGRDEQELRERALLIGTPDEVVESIKGREAQGIDRIMLQTLDMDDTAVLELIAQEDYARGVVAASPGRSQRTSPSAISNPQAA